MRRERKNGGFALVLTLALLALLVLAMYALSVLVKVGSDTSFTGSRQVQAQQNALLGLSVALGELKRLAATDDVTTAVGEISAAAGNRQKRWTGVWGASGFAGWLVSGTPMSFTMSASMGSVLLVGPKTIGSEKPAAGQDYVEAPRVAVPTIGTASGTETLGSFAYWIGDEGVKLSIVAPDDLNTAVGTMPSPLLMRLDPSQIFATYPADDSGNLKILTYDQLAMVKSGLQLGPNFHFAASTAYGVASGLPRGRNTARYKRISGDLLVSGSVNVNTTNADVWKAVSRLACSNLGLVTPGATRQANFATAIINKIRQNGPFLSLAQLRNSGAWDDAIAILANPRPTVDAMEASLEPLLLARSDTFRIRSYGDATDPLDGSTVVATAYCEAIVQRTTETAPNGLGRRFVITYFRWLGPDDI